MFESVLFMVTGAALYGGGHHLYHGIQNRAGHPYVIHALMFSLLAGFALFSATAGAAHSVAELSRAGKISVSLGMLLFATLPWFIALLLQQRARVLPALLATAWGALLLVNIASPFGLLYQDVTAFNQVLPSGQPSAALHTTANPAWHLVEITMLSTLVFSMYLCVQQYRTAGKVVAIAPTAGLLLLLCTTFFDFFVYAGLTQSAYLAPMGFLLFLIAASLHRHPIPGPADRKTPEDAGHYQVTFNFNQTPAPELQTAPTGRSADTTVTVAQLAHQQSDSLPAATLPGDVVETPVAPQVCFNNPTVDLVSDGLVDIAVNATQILKRLEHGDLNAPELKELGRKVRTQAIETRRITYRMLRTKHTGHEPKTD